MYDDPDCWAPKAGIYGFQGSKKRQHPYHIEHATTGRAACRSCFVKIQQGELRVGKSEQNLAAINNGFFGASTSWFHPRCILRAGMNDGTGQVLTFARLPGSHKLRKDLAEENSIRSLLGAPAVTEEAAATAESEKKALAAERKVARAEAAAELAKQPRKVSARQAAKKQKA